MPIRRPEQVNDVYNKLIFRIKLTII